jgi:hypothetical protein
MKRWWRLALPLALATGTVGIGSGAWAHAGVGARARVHAVVRDRLAVVLARSIRLSLGAHARVLAMEEATVAGRRGYLVAFVQGRTRGTLFVSDQGAVRHLPAWAFPRVHRQATAQTPSTSLADFLAALETDLSQLSGTPVSATALPGGGMSFTVNVAGTLVTVVVSPQAQSGSTGGSSSGSSTPTPTLVPPAVSMPSAVQDAISAVADVSAFASGAYAVAAQLRGYAPNLPSSGEGEGPGPMGMGHGRGHEDGHLWGGVGAAVQGPFYSVELVGSASSPAAVAQVWVDAQTGKVLAVDTRLVGQLPPVFSQVAAMPSLATAASDALAADASLSSSVLLSARLLPSGPSSLVWDLWYENPDGSYTRITVNASGQVQVISPQGSPSSGTSESDDE